MRPLLAGISIFLCAAIAIGVTCNHVLCYPELTNAQMLVKAWPLYLTSLAFGFAGVALLRDREWPP
jgi:cbb3-type cytochrome oxidase subunit 1